MAGCDYLGAHVVACDYADSVRESRRPVARARLDRLIKTWIAIASGNDQELTLKAVMRERIVALRRHWASSARSKVPHDIYLVTNRERWGVDRVAIERRMDCFMGHFYHYHEQADLAVACRSADR